MKKQNSTHKIVTIFFSLSLLISSSMLQAKDDFKLNVGAGFFVKKNNRIGNTYENMDKRYFVKPIPVINASYKRFTLLPLGAGYWWLQKDNISSSLFITRTGDRYHGEGMNPRKDSAFVGLNTKMGKFNFIYAHDLHGRSKSNFAKLAYSEHFVFSPNFFLITSLHLDWYDDNYANYYYGVRDHEVTSSRRAYIGKNYIHPAIAFIPMYKITPKLNLSALINFSYIADEVRNSPTTAEDRFALMSMIGISYDLF